MKRLVLILSFALPCFVNAQDFKTLVRQADSLKRKAKTKQALLLYEKAIERVVTYKDKVTDKEWLLASNNAADLTGKKLVPEYDPARYRLDGEIFNKRVNELKANGVKCIFTYNTICDGCTITAYSINPTKRIPYFPTKQIHLLVWVEDEEICIQAYGDNIYKPRKNFNKTLAAFLTNYFNQLALQELNRAHRKIIDAGTLYNFRFYWGDTVHQKRIATIGDITDDDKHVNDDKYLTALLPQIQSEVALYYEWLLLN